MQARNSTKPPEWWLPVLQTVSGGIHYDTATGGLEPCPDRTTNRPGRVRKPLRLSRALKLVQPRPGLLLQVAGGVLGNPLIVDLGDVRLAVLLQARARSMRAAISPLAAACSC